MAMLHGNRTNHFHSQPLIHQYQSLNSYCEEPTKSLTYTSVNLLLFNDIILLDSNKGLKRYINEEDISNITLEK